MYPNGNQAGFSCPSCGRVNTPSHLSRSNRECVGCRANLAEHIKAAVAVAFGPPQPMLVRIINPKLYAAGAVNPPPAVPKAKAARVAAD